MLGEDNGKTPGTRIPSLAKLREGTGRDGGGSLQTPGGPRTAARKGNDNSPRKNANHNVTVPCPWSSHLPQELFFPRETREQDIGPNKSDRVSRSFQTEVLTLLHHNRTKVKFGQDRRTPPIFPSMILLDGVDSVLDSLAPDARPDWVLFVSPLYICHCSRSLLKGRTAASGTQFSRPITQLV